MTIEGRRSLFRFGLSLSTTLCVAFGGLAMTTTARTTATAQVPPPGGSGGDDKGDDEGAGAADAQSLKERQDAIRGLFMADKIEFSGDDVVEIFYDFDREEADQGLDFMPPAEKNPKRMRWSRGWEGHYIAFDYGLVINKVGTWVHKAVWKEVEAEIEFGQLSEIMKPGDIVAVAYMWDKGKKMVASNLGQQLMRLNRNVRPIKAPIPVSIPPMNADQRRTFGVKYSKGIVYALTKGRTQAETSNASWMKKIEPGHIGVVWNGQWVKGIVMEVRLKGVLDPEWLEEQLGKSD